MTDTNLPYPKMIGLSGKQFAGKDQVTQLLLERFPQYRQRPIAQAIKQRYAEENQLTLEAIETHKANHRPGLIAMGNWGRAQDYNFWLKTIIAEADTQPLIISDVRLLREYDLLKQHQAFLIRVEATREVRGQRGLLVSEDDPTECELDTINDWDAVLVNNTDLVSLSQQVSQMTFKA